MRSERSLECGDAGIARAQKESGQLHDGGRQGKLSIIGLGPGARSYMAPEALGALGAAQIVLGYKTYLELVGDLLHDKTVVAGAMRKEVERCQAAIDFALAGKNVALLSSGDAGIYGMAGLVLDICRQKGIDVWEWDTDLSGEAQQGAEEQCAGEAPRGARGFFLRVIPGIAAFNAAASILGAPLMHDFAAVSLSDHLTPWEVIERRLHAASEADFVLALYNPRSKSRPDLLEKARQIILRSRLAQTPAGIVGKAMREGQWRRLCTLADLPVEEVDMQTVIIVGNSQTYVWKGWMITPRGYLDKYAVDES
ncbi:MAG: precorrin-3B C(17)-methyltransferase [Syntrophobacteraceae bacterium]|nr:precorrin-3B C(17)-methyltransferase [Syntrophobacteraceae bacterium]